MNILDCMPGFTFGCDPEGFVVNDKGVPVSPDMIPGTKKEPFKVPYGAVQRDGMAAEFNIDPVSTFADFNRNIASVMKSLEGFLPKGYSISYVPSVTFGQAEFDAAPDDAKQLGCSPDFNAWTGEINPPPNDPENPFLRTASGHLHVGWGDGFDLSDAQHMMNCQDLVKQFDWFLGAYSVSQDTDPTRRRLYGRAGAMRPKPYGVEYRVLSNFWITSRERRLAVWNRACIGINEMRTRFMPDKVPAMANDMIQDYINETRRNRGIEAQYSYPIVTLDASPLEGRISARRAKTVFAEIYSG